MGAGFLKSLFRPDFRHQIAMALISGIIATAIISTIAISKFSSRSVEENLVKEGVKVTENLAVQSTLGLLLFSPENVEDAVNATLNFPDVIGVGVFDLEGKPLMEAGETERLSGASYAPDHAQMVSENDSEWYFSAPVYSTFAESEEQNPFGHSNAKELIGYVYLTKSKETLHAMEQSIRHINMWISLGLAGSLLIVLILITQRVTNPLKKLMEHMRRAQAGDTTVRADLEGPRDIIEMEVAFNTMMEALEDRSEQLEAARDTALESARIKGEFAANVSHELRTPLNGILGMLELLAEMGGLSAKQKEYVQVARNSGDALLVLIDNILDFSRVDSGKMQISFEDFNLREVLESVLEILANQARAKDLDLAYVVSEGVPAYIGGDAARVRQVLINLGGNAIKFTESGEVGFFVSKVDQDENKFILRFEVKDTGIGIPKEAQQRIFEAFSQADGSTTRKYGGTGLGLAICKRLVEVLGGKIGVDSEPEKGSSFWFELPVSKADAYESGNALSKSMAIDKRVLVVDDSELVQLTISNYLEKWGADVQRAGDGENAYDIVERAQAGGRPFDMVFVDELMPGANGIEIIRELSKAPGMKNSKLIMLTNQTHADSFLDRFAEINAYLSKPVLQSSLFDCIASAMSEEKPFAENSTVPDTSALPVQIRVLVAEDNRANQKVATGMLERIGCEVTLADNGNEAVAKVTREEFDLVLMDCNMPELDGYKATQLIRDSKDRVAQVPIIAMTANVQEGDRQKCLRAGMDDYLSKPLKLDKLRSKLVKWVTKLSKEENSAEELHVTQQNKVSESPLNLSVLNELQESVGPAYEDMLEVFCEDLPVLLTSLENALKEQDSEQVMHYAHSIKGSSKNFGANLLAGVAKELEMLGKSQDLSTGQELLDLLFKRAQDVLRYLKNSDHVRMGEVEDNKVDVSEAARILIADDDRSIRLALTNVLGSDGYLIDEVSDGAQAVAMCEKALPDLVLLDGIMPVMGGFEACASIRSMPGARHVPILIITALEDDDSIERAFNVGATDYVTKPVHFSVLRQRIGRLLRASQAERHVHQLAYNDPLTGLPNRTMFMSRLEELLSKVRRQDEIMALLFLDLNRFKLVNDTLGHSVGDLLLKAVAERLQRCVRSGDIVARLGGDEFTVILDRVQNREQVARIAQDICDSLNRPFSFAGQEMFVSTSIGISVFPQDGEDIGSLMKHADTAMFRAKEQGINFFFYENHMEAAVTHKVEIEADLRRAIDRDEIDVFYQPMADLRTRDIIGMEALVRWNHPTRGMVRPDDFIPLAEETGLITEIGLWVMISACVQLQTWMKAGYSPYRVSVNLSGVQLERGNIIKQVEQVLAETGLEPRFLELEITESTIMHHPEQVISVLKKLKSMGVSLAIDDFGTGYSSLNYLKRFPIDMLKIDASFVRDIAVDPDDKAIIRGIIALAKSLRLKVIAEGVETREQEEFLRDEGCDLIQGYYVGKPLSSIEFEQRVLEQVKVGRSVVSDMSLYRPNYLSTGNSDKNSSD